MIGNVYVVPVVWRFWHPSSWSAQCTSTEYTACESCDPTIYMNMFSLWKVIDELGRSPNSLLFDWWWNIFALSPSKVLQDRYLVIRGSKLFNKWRSSFFVPTFATVLQPVRACPAGNWSITLGYNLESRRCRGYNSYWGFCGIIFCPFFSK